MDGRYVEPRKVMWAVAEISWQDAAGTSFRAPATLEDTSPSGACIRIRQPFPVGSRLTVKWHREQFSAVARNCRSDGRTSSWECGGRPRAHVPRAKATTRPRQKPSRWLISLQNAAESALPPWSRRNRIQFETSRQDRMSSSRILNELAVDRNPQQPHRDANLVPSFDERPNLRRRRLGLSHKVPARPLIPKGKLCSPKRYFRNSGAVSRTETRPRNPHLRRLQ